MRNSRRCPPISRVTRTVRPGGKASVFVIWVTVRPVSDFRERYGAWALVAGASEGLGAAFAEQLAARGMNVLLLARREELLAELAGRLSAEYGIETRWRVLDLSDP